MWLALASIKYGFGPTIGANSLAKAGGPVVFILSLTQQYRFQIFPQNHSCFKSSQLKIYNECLTTAFSLSHLDSPTPRSYSRNGRKGKPMYLANVNDV